MSRVLKTVQAEEDLHEIWAYVAGDDPTAADKLIGEFDRTFRLLGNHPKMARERPRVLPSIRSLRLGNYLIFLVEEGKGIKIVRVLHGARNLEGIEFNPHSEGH